ncbi:MAG: tRNA pseudouridine(55) synthase TruB [Gemmatimonadota bacterium]|nr:MAG: tRNA pseudouridine(55) synthase TruB [Gemmatimonadota bacterium]
MDKPAGPTAHDAVSIVRRAVGARRAGHTGTLDPFATGLLVVLTGRATRLARFLSGLKKTYTGKIRLGAVTDTGDPTGEIIGRSAGWRELSDERIESELHSLTGPISQVPPAYSAKKVAGQRAYRLARQGKPVKLEPREVCVFRFEMLRRVGDCLEFGCEVSSGTYIRALARDLGTALGCGAYLEELRRVSVGPHQVAAAVPLDSVGSDTELRPPLQAVSHLPAVQLDEEARRRVRHGQPVAAATTGGGPVALVADATLVAVAQPQEGWLRPKVVLEG